MNKKKVQHLSGYHDFKSVLKPRISKEDYHLLRDHATSLGVSLADFKDFTGKTAKMMELLDKIPIVATDFPKITSGRKHVVIGLTFKNNDVFAYTYKNKITLNGIYYNDDIFAAEDYQRKVKEKEFVEGTTWEHVIFHELGHVVCYMYGLDPLQIAKDVINTDSTAEVIEYVAGNLSRYSATTFDSMTEKVRVFDGTEVMAESFCGHYGGASNTFADAYVNKCKQIVREKEVMP